MPSKPFMSWIKVADRKMRVAFVRQNKSTYVMKFTDIPSLRMRLDDVASLIKKRGCPIFRDVELLNDGSISIQVDPRDRQVNDKLVEDLVRARLSATNIRSSSVRRSGALVKRQSVSPMGVARI